MGLYERLLEERAREERRRGGPRARPTGRTPRSSTGYCPIPSRTAGVPRRPGDHAPATLEGSAQSKVKPEVKVQLNRSGSLASRSSRVW